MSNGKVREYIGARYVPIFADPVQWDIDNTYDPLTMVQNAGETYMTKQYVPAGIELPTVSTGQESNDYWVHMSNWNAQVEAYREEVIAYAAEVLEYNGRITAVENGLPIADYDSEHTVTDAINAVDTAINAIIGTGFDSTNTVAKAISDEIDEREAQDFIRPICFANVAAMKASTDIADGMICRTEGFYSINDGGGAWYQISDSGTANEMDVIACGSLYAILIENKYEYNVHQYGAYGNGTDDDSDIVQYVINKAMTNANNSINKVVSVVGKNLYFEKQISIVSGGDSVRFNIDFKSVKSTYAGYAIVFSGAIDGWKINVDSFESVNGGCMYFASLDYTNTWCQYSIISSLLMKANVAYDCLHFEADKQSANPGWINNFKIKVMRFIAGRWGIYAVNCYCFTIDTCGFEYTGAHIEKCNNWIFINCRMGERPNSAYLLQTVGFCEGIEIIGGENQLLSRYDEPNYAGFFTFSNQTYGLVISHQESAAVADYSGEIVFNIVAGQIIRANPYWVATPSTQTFDTSSLSSLQQPTLIRAGSNDVENIILDGKFYGGYGKINKVKIESNSGVLKIYRKDENNINHLMYTINNGNYHVFVIEWERSGAWGVYEIPNYTHVVDYN